MTDALLSTGLQIDDFETRFARVTSELRAAISAVLDLSADQPTGQLARIPTEHIQQVVELLQELYSAIDPDQATGQSLDAVSSITGTYRKAATFGDVAVTLNLNAAAVVPAGTIFSVSGDSDNRWLLDTAVTAVGAGNYAGTCTAESAGVFEAPAGTLTVIVTPVAGLNSVTNAADANPGDAEETDQELRVRRAVEVAGGGSTSVDSVQAAVSAIEGVNYAALYDNPYDTAQNGQPPHSIETVYWEGSGAPTAALVAEIAQAIFDEKAGGIRAYGTDTDGAGTLTETVTDSQGNDQQIGFTLATEKTVQLEYTLTTNSNYPGDADFKSTIATWAASNQEIAEDVFAAQYIAQGMGVAGVENLSLRLRFTGDAWGVIDLPVADREIATVATGDITVL